MTIAIANRQTLAPLDTKALRSLCRSILRAHGTEANLSLCYVDDAAIRALNAQYHHRDAPTDVLAFPLDDPQDPAAPPQDRVLGDVVVSVQTALAQARRRRIPLARELALYTAHGLLHLLGYDDHTPAQRRAMRRAERAALAAARLL